MNKREKMLAMIDPSRGIGVEIGPLDNPTVAREIGEVRYVDHASTEQLRVKNRENPFVRVDRIVDVDYVWGDRSLPELLAAEAPFDYVVASHVIEHVPDLVGWLGEIRAILRPGGVLSLAVPDKRLCFDYYRYPTTAADVLEAYLRKERRPGFRRIFEHLASFSTVDGALTWEAGPTVAPSRQMSARAAWELAQAASAEATYHDVHCWVFTPATFFRLLATLIELDLFEFRVAAFFPTSGYEFHVSFKALEGSEGRENARTSQLESLPRIREDVGDAVRGLGRRLVPPARSFIRRVRAIAARARRAASRR